MAHRHAQRPATATEPPPLSPAQRERMRQALRRYDKGSLVRMELRLGLGKTKELAARPREVLEAGVVEACEQAAVVRRMLEGLSPLQLRLLEMGAGQHGVAEVADLLRTAMQAVPPQTADWFDGVRFDMAERRRRAMPVLVELYSRGLLWPPECGRNEGGETAGRTRRGAPGQTTGPQRSLVGCYHAGTGRGP